MSGRLKPVLAAVAMTLAVATAVPASAATGAKLKAALAQLDLSAAQQAQLKQIFAQAKSARATQAVGTTTTARHGRAILQQVMAVLTAPQKAKLQTILAAEKGVGRPRVK